MLICEECNQMISENESFLYPKYSEEEIKNFNEFVEQCKIHCKFNDVEQTLPKAKLYHYRNYITNGIKGKIGSRQRISEICGPLREMTKEEQSSFKYEQQIENLMGKINEFRR